MANPYRFDEHVFPAELASITKRLEARKQRLETEGTSAAEARSPGRAVPEVPPADPRPSTAHGLVGLALSGGGIRSAMFNLGILQGLHRSGLLRHVDYLSTVSGGGYIGGMWSALTHASGAPFPFAHGKQTPEPPAVVHLRNNANYLLLGGPVDAVRMAMVILRGVLLNVLVILPYLILFAVVTSLVYWPYLVTEDGQRLGSDALTPFAVTRYLLPAYIGVLLLTPLATRVMAWKEARRPKFTEDTAREDAEHYRERDLFERSIAYGALLVAGAGFLELQPIVVSLFRDLQTGGYRELVTGIGGALSVVTALLARQSSGSGGLRARAILLVAGLLGPLIPILLYVYLADWLIYEGTDPGYLYEKGWALTAVALLVYTHVFVDVNQHSGHRFWRDRLSRAFLRAPGTAGVLDHVDGLALSQLGQPGSEAPYHLLNTTLNLQGDREMVNRARYGDFFVFSKHFVGGDRVGYIPTPVMEKMSPQVNLGTAMAISSAAAAPNMGAATITSMTALMTILNVRMGFWIPQPGRLAEWLGLDAADPETAPRRSGLGLLRWRAGPLYLRHEMLGNLHSGSALVNVSDGGHLENLGVYELLRRRCRYIICGDGEADPNMHFGSLAALIRYARLDLGVEIDIELGDVALATDRSPGRQHCALGTIRYPAVDGAPEEQGVLLYMKSSLTGDEDSMLAQYRASSPTFPHESTADQFFSEAQLEAYRSLGYHIATSTFEDALGPAEGLAEGEARALPYAETARGATADQPANPGLTGAFRRLRITLATQPQSSDTTFSELQGELGDVLRHAGPDELFEYYAELFPEIDDGLPATQARRIETDGVYRRRILEVVGGQLALMESVYRRLDLHQARMRRSEANAGWISLFRRWASARSFRWAATLHAPSMSQGFRVFCHDVLGMEWSLAWRAVGDDAPAWAPQDVPAGTIRLIGSVVIGGMPVEPREALTCVDILDDGATLRLGPHLLRPGFQGGDLYRLLLRELAGLVGSGSPLLPEERTWTPCVEHLLPSHRRDVDARDIALGIRMAPPPRRPAAPLLLAASPAVPGVRPPPVAVAPPDPGAPSA